MQKILEEALGMILDEQVSATGAGRTDAGVHAKVFCAHFDSIKPGLANDSRLVYRLNGYLPEDIAVKEIKKVVPDASARYSAISRTYTYYISRRKDPFTTSFAWYLYGNIDLDSMNRACRVLYDHSDFTSFSRLHSGSKSNICRIYEAHWKEENGMLVFTIRADRFLRNMVRAVVGTMIGIGFGKTRTDEFEKIILARDRGMAGTSAPAKGLFLSDIEYPPEIFI